VVSPAHEGLAEGMLGLPGYAFLPGVGMRRGEDPPTLWIDLWHEGVEMDREAVRNGSGLAVLHDEGRGRVETELDAELVEDPEHLRRGRCLGGRDDEVPDGEGAGVAVCVGKGVAHVGGGPAQDPHRFVLRAVEKVGEGLGLPPAPGVDAAGFEDHVRTPARCLSRMARIAAASRPRR
jgi:hypothetical protein